MKDLKNVAKIKTKQGKVLELSPEDFPIKVENQAQDQKKEYFIYRTKEEKLAMNTCVPK